MFEVESKTHRGITTTHFSHGERIVPAAILLQNQLFPLLIRGLKFFVDQ